MCVHSPPSQCAKVCSKIVYSMSSSSRQSFFLIQVIFFLLCFYLLRPVRSEGNIYNESWIRQVKWMWALGDLENTSRRNAVLGALKSSRFIEVFHINLWTLSIFHAVEWKNNTTAIFLLVVWESKNTRRWSGMKRSLMKSQLRILLRKGRYAFMHVAISRYSVSYYS